jgi:rhamnose transport system permease protein
MSSKAPSLLQGLVRWETALLVALVIALLYGAATPNFFTATNGFYVGLNVGEVAIMTLPLTLIIMSGEIDLSVASMLGLASTLLGLLVKHGWPIVPAMLVVLLVGIAGGALNGFLITRVGLPSIAVTIGTLTLFRGIAQILLGAQSVTGFSLWLTKIGVQPIPHTRIAWSVGFFLVLAVIFGVVLHATPVGRSIVAIGLQSEAAQFSGIRVRRIKFQLYVLSGLVCAFAGILWTLRFATSRYDAGTGLELTVVAIVLFGGVSIFGGRGTILGVVLSAGVIACLQQALTLRKVDPQVRNIVIGVLLLLSVVLPNVGRMLQERRHRPRGSPRPATEAAAAGTAASRVRDVPMTTTATNHTNSNHLSKGYA